MDKNILCAYDSFFHICLFIRIVGCIQSKKKKNAMNISSTIWKYICIMDLNISAIYVCVSYKFDYQKYLKIGVTYIRLKNRNAYILESKWSWYVCPLLQTLCLFRGQAPRVYIKYPRRNIMKSVASWTAYSYHKTDHIDKP